VALPLREASGVHLAIGIFDSSRVYYYYPRSQCLRELSGLDNSIYAGLATYSITAANTIPTVIVGGLRKWK
jgi:hypothetical protein